LAIAPGGRRRKRMSRTVSQVILRFTDGGEEHWFTSRTFDVGTVVQRRGQQWTVVGDSERQGLRRLWLATAVAPAAA
jgi:hypothetical protein